MTLSTSASTNITERQSTTDAAVTTAQLQDKIRELRAQVAQLKAAQNTSDEKTTTSGSHKSKDTMSGQHKKMGGRIWLRRGTPARSLDVPTERTTLAA